jgi:predicted peroxiredoxin
MARIFIHCTHGSENPTRAGLAWLMAKGFVEAGHKPEVTLAGDGAILAFERIAEGVFPVGLPPLKELIGYALEHRVPIHV